MFDGFAHNGYLVFKFFEFFRSVTKEIDRVVEVPIVIHFCASLEKIKFFKGIADDKEVNISITAFFSFCPAPKKDEFGERDIFHYILLELFELRGYSCFLTHWSTSLAMVRNHDTFSLSGFELRDYFTEGDIAFFHGHKEFVELYGGGANYLVMGHAHPSVTLRDSAGVKKEKFKCYLTGKWKKKEIIVLPSFLDINYGTDVDEYDDFGVVPSKIFKTFDVHVISDSGEVFRFGKVGDL